MKITMDTSEFEDGVEEAEKKSSTFFDHLKANVASQAIVGGVKKMAGAIQNLGSIALDYNREIENYTTNFSVMMGDAAAAAAKVEELKDLGASTPFELGDLAGATQTLLAFNVSADDSTSVLRRLGDISLGNVQKLESLTRAYGKMNASQKVTLEDINMMIDAGFNPLLVVAEQTGESMTDLYSRVSSGEVAFSEIQGAIETATSAGGQFFEGMAQASQTTDGLISTLQDNIRSKLGEAFQSVSAKINEMLPLAIKFVDSIDTDKVVGSIKAAANAFVAFTPIIAGAAAGMAAFKAASAIAGIIDALRKATEAQTVAQAALNAVMNLNPYVRVATLIATVVAALATLLLTNEDFRNKIKEIWGAVTGFISTAVGKITTFFTVTIPDAAKTAIAWFEAIPERMKEVGANIVGKLWEGIKSMAGWLGDKVTGWIDGIFGKSSKELSEASASSPTTSMAKGFQTSTATSDFASSGLGVASAGIVNGIAANSAQGGISTVNLMFPDGTNFARYVLPDMINVARDSGTPILNPS